MFDYKNASAKDALNKIKEIAHETGANDGLNLGFVKKEYKAIPQILDENEQVYAITSGTFNKGNKGVSNTKSMMTTGVIILTNKRIVLFDKGFFFGTTLISFSFNKINTVSYKTGIFMATIFIENANSVSEITDISKKSASIFVEKTLQIMEQIEENKNNPEVNQEEDKYIKLEKIAELLEKGILTQEEFSMEKQKILKEE